jgi:hypothetical protein
LHINDSEFFPEPLPRNDKGIITEPLPSNDRGIHRHTHRQQRDLISLLYFYQNKGSRLESRFIAFYILIFMFSEAYGKTNDSEMSGRKAFSETSMVLILKYYKTL